MTDKTKGAASPTHNVGIPRGGDMVQAIIAYGKMLTPPKTAGELLIESFEQVHGDQMKIVMSARKQIASGQKPKR